MREKLSIIMPVFNEENTILKIIQKVLSVNFFIDSEIIIINDGSTDSTKSKLLSVKKNKKLKIFHLNENHGKGYAIRKGIEHSSGTVIIIQDTDLEYNPIDILPMLNFLIKNKLNVVYGSRFLNQKFSIFGKNKPKLVSHLIGNKILTFLTNIVFRSNLTDMETCYKMFRNKILKDFRLISNGFEIEPEITAKILKSGYKIFEVEVKHWPRNFSAGKKITKLDGFKSLYSIFKYRFF